MEAGTITREQAAVLALARHTHSPWHLIAQAIEQSGSDVRQNRIGVRERSVD